MKLISISLTILAFSINSQIFLPLELHNRSDISQIQLTQIGEFGLLRKSRPGIPEHFHTGIDIKRPTNNYLNEPIFPIAKGKVISKRDDGAYANIIIEHEFENIKFWTLYEHVADIKVNVNDNVNPNIPIARFMNKEELSRFGWQFDHFHLEILKIKPTLLKPDRNLPSRFFKSYSLVCYTIDDLNKYYFNPIEFFNKYLE
ncbi:MAG: M23 family metallopeptidase [Tenuifilaceae bacterium]